MKYFAAVYIWATHQSSWNKFSARELKKCSTNVLIIQSIIELSKYKYNLLGDSRYQQQLLKLSNWMPTQAGTNDKYLIKLDQ